MNSGNFLVGHDLKLAGFDEYVTPRLKKKGVAVTDRLSVSDGGASSVLVALSGKGDLVSILSGTLIAAAGEIGRLPIQEQIGGTASPHQLREYPQSGVEEREKARFTTLGIYSDLKTASQLFPSIAQKYLAEEATEKVEEVTDQLEKIRDALKGFE